VGERYGERNGILGRFLRSGDRSPTIEMQIISQTRMEEAVILGKICLGLEKKMQKQLSESRKYRVTQEIRKVQRDRMVVEL